MIDLNNIGALSVIIKLVPEQTGNSGLNFKISNSKYNSTYQSDFKSSILTINNISIISSGRFYFLASANIHNIPDNRSNSFTALNEIKNIIAVIPTISNYFDFNINFSFIGEDDNYFLGSENLEISETTDLSLAGNLKYSNISSFKMTDFLYFLRSGQASLNYKIGLITYTSNFTVYQSKIKINLNNTVNFI